MIRFFHQIRKKLLEHLPAGQAGNKIRTYILYAVGEIALVMIGILLALQVNNWNEYRKAQTYEQTLLIELQKAVRDDINFFGGHLLMRRNVNKKESHRYFEQIIKGEEVDLSKLDEHVKALIYGNTFHVNDGAYESIKSSGLDKISNKEIRSFITKFYEFHLPRFENLIGFSLHELEDARKNDYPKLLNAPTYNLEDGFNVEYTLASFDMNTNPHFIRLLEKSIQWESSSTRTYNQMLTLYEELDEMLEAELKRFTE